MSFNMPTRVEICTYTLQTLVLSPDLFGKARLIKSTSTCLHKLFYTSASVVCTAWGIPYILQPDGSANLEASLMQVLTHISTTSRPTKIQTWDIGS
eukprot:8567824-Ditylum_brightwellii.AAC.1